ncbi:nickel import ATP-binding protein NikD, putative [Synechococcus sp. PCC 7335]|uniref:ABC transporter ATP-binding protein n=1 Tax=Synechococcus sp. (strain ATCC 29403 / PCC 7335) TaxID=91464 RepID=UPI00017EE089|nr:ABC transporter ATP-binding protein [Synechococcus sp. PCC 7335]EDX87426.1 nickel import ATP-binding protein NikD, putative [Synechococcus sp. PCC 7335]
MTFPILDVRNLSIAFPTKTGAIDAVKSVSFSIDPGQTLGLVGESGSGKSVTSLALIGLLEESTQVSGEIWFCDPNTPNAEPVDLLKLSLEDRRRYRGRLISMIFQEPLTSLNPVYTCGDQLIEALKLHQDLTGSAAEAKAIALFEEVKLPKPKQVLGRYPHQLSGGQQQRVMIAIALAGNPAVLIADEPTTALDVTIQSTILDLLRDLQTARGTAILFITHDMGVVSQIADRVAVMYKGDLVEIAPVYELFANPQHPYTQGLLNCRPRPNKQLRRLPTVSDFMNVDENKEITATVRTEAERAELLAEVSPTEIEQHRTELLQQQPLLTVNELTKGFPVRHGFFSKKTVFRAVDSVSFDVYPGETLGLVGESGCGKSTLSRCLLRLIEPTSGSISFDGQSVLALSSDEMRRLRREMQIVFQNPYGSLDARQTIGSAIMEPMRIHGLGGDERQRRSRTADLLERVGLSASAMSRMPFEFSGGQRQRVCIARTLACEPKFIICDESVSALDVSVQAQVLNLLKDLQQEFNLTYIFISHDLSVVKFVSDRIMVMNKGRIEEIGPSEAIYNSPQRPYTQELIAAIPDAKLEDIRRRQTVSA